MESAVIRWLVLGLALCASTSADAQRRPDRPSPRARQEAPRFGLPGPPRTIAPPAEDGIIRWNTPNKDGNLGGPSAGGSGGGGG